MKLIRFISAMVRLAYARLTGKPIKADTTLIANRLVKCIMCGSYREQPYSQCAICECYLDPHAKPYDWIPAKTELLTEKCPKNKW